MRIKIEGRHSLEEVIDRIGYAIKMLTEMYPIDSFTGINLYLNILDKDGEVVTLVNSEGDELAMMLFRDSRKPKKLKKKRQIANVLQMPDPNLELKTTKPS